MGCFGLTYLWGGVEGYMKLKICTLLHQSIMNILMENFFTIITKF